MMRTARGGSLVVLLALTGAANAHAAPRPDRGGELNVEVKYVHRDHVYVNAGRDQGLTSGTTAEVLRKGKRVARVRFDSVSGSRASAVFVNREKLPKEGDVVRFKATPPPAAAPPPALVRARPVTALTWPLPGSRFVPHGYEGHGPAPAPRARASAFLRAQGWAFVDGRTVSATTRQRLWIRLDSALDPDNRLWVNVDANLVAQELRPRDTRFEPYALAWMELYQASVTWKASKSLEIGVGRRPTFGVRYGLVDGVFVAWRWLTNGPTLHLAVGQRPHTTRLTTSLNRPTANLSLDGVYSWGWGSVFYAAGVAWLGRNWLSTEGGEAAARATLELGRTLWLDADVAAMAWLPTQSLVPRGAVDRLGLQASTRQGPVTLRGSARRLNNAPLPSDLGYLPGGYLPGIPFYDVGMGVDVALPGLVSGGGGLSGGAMWDETHLMDRVYINPTANIRVSNLWGLAVRGGWRGEFGPTTAQLLDVGVSAQPTQGFHIGTWQQLGTWWLLERRDVMPFWAWNLNAEYRFLGTFAAGLRGRGVMNLTPEPGASVFNGWLRQSTLGGATRDTTLGGIYTQRYDLTWAYGPGYLGPAGSGVEAMAYVGAVDRP